MKNYRLGFLVLALAAGRVDSEEPPPTRMQGDGRPEWLPPDQKAGVLQVTMAKGWRPNEEFRNEGRKDLAELIRELMLSKLRDQKAELGLSGYPASDYFKLISRIASATSSAAEPFKVVRREIRRHEYLKERPREGVFMEYVLVEVPHEDLWRAASVEIEKLEREGAVPTDRIASVVQKTIEGLSLEFFGGTNYRAPFDGRRGQKEICPPPPKLQAAETEMTRISTEMNSRGYASFVVSPKGDFVAVREQNTVQFWRLGDSSVELAESLPIERPCRFDYGLALSDDRLVLSDLCAADACPQDPECRSGAVKVFRRENGQWIPEARLTSTEGWKELSFGQPLKIEGDRLLVGSSAFTHEQHDRPGVVHVFRREGASWTLEGALKGAMTDMDFGSSPCLLGNLAAVGAPTYDPLGRHSGMHPPGRVRTYQFENGQWVDGPVLTAFDAMGGEGFGGFIVMDGNTLAVSSLRDSTTRLLSGSVYVYGLEKGNWVLQDKVTPPDIRPEQEFGRALALRGNSLFAVAQPTERTGVVYEFEKCDGVWKFVRRLSSSDISDHYVGSPIRITDRWLIVGAARRVGMYSYKADLLLFPLRETDSPMSR